MRCVAAGRRAAAAASILSPYTLGRPRRPGAQGGGRPNSAVSRRTWPTTACPRRRAAWISEARIYQASSSRHSGPRRSPTARSKALASAIFPASSGARHRPVTIGTQRGRSRQATTVPSVTKAWHSRKGLAQQEGGTVPLVGMVEAHGRSRRLGRCTGGERVVDDGEAPSPMALAPDNAAQRGNQAQQPEPTALEHPVVRLPAQARRQG